MPYANDIEREGEVEADRERGEKETVPDRKPTRPTMLLFNIRFQENIALTYAKV